MKGHTYSKRRPNPNPAPSTAKVNPAPHHAFSILQPFLHQFGRCRYTPDRRVLKWNRLTRRIARTLPRGQRGAA